MKVLFAIDSLQQGGAEQSIAHIIRHFSKETQVSILYFYPKSDLIFSYTSEEIDGEKLLDKLRILFSIKIISFFITLSILDKLAI